MKLLLVLTAAAGIFAQSTSAAPYTLFIYESAGQLALRPGNDPATLAYWQAYDAFGKELAAAGVLRGGSALMTGAPVSQVSAGASMAGAEPYAASPLALGGYFQIDVATDEDAVAWAQRLPVIGGVVEIRAGYPVPGMPM
jgi:hypothetical protein